MNAKFTRVTLEKELRADTDGMPPFRRCFDHEVLMSFYDDAGCFAFQEWWREKGSTLFNEWLKESEEYKHIHNGKD